MGLLPQEGKFFEFFNQQSIDKCEDVANVIEGIVLENA